MALFSSAPDTNIRTFSLPSIENQMQLLGVVINAEDRNVKMKEKQGSETNQHQGYRH